ncbi:MAG TPA: hypothetical protein PLJ38_12135, partial [bacterium]|nr:hypothetical protein [bacterium]
LRTSSQLTDKSTFRYSIESGKIEFIDKDNNIFINSYGFSSKNYVIGDVSVPKSPDIYPPSNSITYKVGDTITIRLTFAADNHEHDYKNLKVYGNFRQWNTSDTTVEAEADGFG